MRMKSKLLTVGIAYLFLLGQASIPNEVLAAASGNYTDLLPIGAAGNTTVISNGSGWSLTTLAPTQTFGDSLSRLVDTVYQSTGPANLAGTATSTFTALSQGNVGSTTFPAAWIASGRSIETIVEGSFTTHSVPPTWTIGISLATTSVMSTGALTAPGSVTGGYFKARSVMTVAATGISGSILGEYEIFCSSTNGAVVTFSTATQNTTTVDLTSQLTVNPTLKWSVANSSIEVRNVSVRFLN